ncbi:M15 family metallopeptidase [Kribbella deserti]|uniref:M15 family metallopeptidase n=1 Tax=Kribbella deserti TaxID=1926257 RepID=A0ABV6QDU1_9ACTN
MPLSQNGYSANDITATSVQIIPGTVRKIRLRKGDTGWLLRHFAAWFDKHIETIDHDGQLDDWGYAERPIRGSKKTLSNHASGTAIDLNAPEHPLGVWNTFTSAQETKIRQQLKIYEGCIRWGGDYKNGRPDEMHFEINKHAAAVTKVARKLRGTGANPKPPAPGSDTTISLWSMNHARQGLAMNGTTLTDVQQFMAFTRVIEPATKDTEQAWLRAVQSGNWARASELYVHAVKVVQTHARLTQDGIFGPKTGAYLTKRGGWTIT